VRKSEPEYTKIRGSGYKKGSFVSLRGIRASLWLGADHILCMYNKGYEEDYRRFYYRDIQAITTHLDSRRKAWNIALGICALCFAFWGLKVFSISAIFLLCMLVNWLRGPTCTCYLQTAVSRERLVSLNRLKNADHFMDLVSPLIEKSQGKIDPEELKTNITERIQREVRSKISKNAHVERSYNGIFHKWLFILLVSCGILTSIDFVHNSLVLTFLIALVSSALGIMMILSLVKQHGALIGQFVKVLTWSTLGYMCIAGFIFYVVATYLSFHSATVILTSWDYMKMMSTHSPHDNPFLMGIYITSIIYCFSAGLTGLVLLRDHRHK
jgi:hypothetical protein